MAKMKRCLECERNKTLDRFYRSESAHDNLSLLCIGCLHRYGRLSRQCGEHKSIQEFPVDEEGCVSDCRECKNDSLDSSFKRCSYCQERKPRDQFGRNKRKKDGLAIYCKQCRAHKYKTSHIQVG